MAITEIIIHKNQADWSQLLRTKIGSVGSNGDFKLKMLGLESRTRHGFFPLELEVIFRLMMKNCACACT
jgi:hypothetical protein